MPQNVNEMLGNQQRQAVEMFQSGKHEKGLAAALSVVAEARRQVGARSPMLEVLLLSTGEMHEVLGDFKAADRMFSEALDIRRFVAGNSDLSLLGHLLRVARVRLALSENESAKSIALESLSICEKKVGDDSEHLITPLNVLAKVYLAANEPEEALAAAQRAIQVTEESEIQEVRSARLEALMLLGDSQMRCFDLDDASGTMRRALDEARKLFGEGSPGVVVCQEKLAGMLESEGMFADADALRRAACESVRAVCGQASIEFISKLVWLARSRGASGNSAEAARLLGETAQIILRSAGPVCAEYVEMLLHLSDYFAGSGNFARGAEAREVSLRLYRQLGGIEAACGEPLLALARLCVTFDRAKAASTINQAVAALRKRDIKPDETLVEALLLKGDLHGTFDELDAAEQCYQEAFELIRTMEGASSPARAELLERLGALGRCRGKFEQAVNTLVEAERLTRQTSGEAHPDHAEVLNQLGTALAANGKFGDAAALMRQSVMMTFNTHDNYRRDRRSLILRMPATLRRDADDLICALRQGNLPPATGWEAIWAVTIGGFESLLDSDVQRLKRLHPLSADKLSRVERLSARWRWLEGADANGATRQLVARREETLRSIQAGERALVDEIPELAAVLRARSATVSQVAGAMASGSILIELYRHPIADFRAIGLKQYWKPMRYTAFVIESGSGEDVKTIDFGEAAPIDAAAVDLHRSLSNRSSIDQISARAQVLWQRLSGLHALLRDAVARQARVYFVADGDMALIPLDALPLDGKPLIESIEIINLTSGSDLVRFMSMPTDSPAIFSRPDFSAALPAAPSVPDPWTESAAAKVFRAPGPLGRGARWLRNKLNLRRKAELRPVPLEVLLKPVPAPAISAQFPRAGEYFTQDEGWNRVSASVTDLLRVPAREANQCTAQGLSDLRSPRFLHLAAPWFAFSQALDDPNDLLGSPICLRCASIPGSNLPENPLVLCGIALSGANAALKDPCPSRGRDGIISAIDLANLDLGGTEAVTLPIAQRMAESERCGLSVVHLLRAFVAAGARGIVYAVSPLDPESVEPVLRDFYRSILGGASTATALRQARLAARAARPNDPSWMCWSCVGGAAR